MLSIITTVESTPSGAGKVVAKGHGKQRSVRINHALSDEQNRAAAAGTLVNVLTDARQQAMLRHPTGRQRIRVASISDGGGKHRWTIDV